MYIRHYFYFIFLGISVATVHSCLNREVKSEDRIPWEKIIHSKEAKIPTTSQLLNEDYQVLWLNEMDDALVQARLENKPLFVTMRCIPCKQCSDFDKDVLENDGDLKSMLAQFVTVRLTSIKDIDLRLFPVQGYQDLDLSWWGWFLSPEGQTYSIYGGRDHLSDTTRMSIKSLVSAGNRVLDHHYQPDRKKWDIDGPIPHLAGIPYTSRDLPGWDSWYAKAPEEYREQKCLHCHQLSEVLRQPQIDEEKFDKKNDFDIWPLPENIGLVVNRDHGLLIDSVMADSPASKIGLASNDVLVVAGDRRLFSQADLMGVLHRGPKSAGIIPIYWIRNEKLQHASLEVLPGWRKTNLEWRKSVAEAAVGAHWGGGWPLRSSDEIRNRWDIRQGQMAVSPWFGPNPKGAAYQAGLRPQHTVIRVNQYSEEKYGRAFNYWFRMQFEPGDNISLTVINQNGKKEIIEYTL